MSCNVLVMDDSRVARSMVRRSLSLIGFDFGEIFEAQNGFEGLGIVKSEKIGLMLIDLNMPEMSGFEFARLIDRSPTLASIPMVLISSERSETRLKALLEKENLRYVPKPFKPETLRDVLAELLGGSK
jgi:two-component system, chemotaxis family, chemotaxis protein CheY